MMVMMMLMMVFFRSEAGDDQAEVARVLLDYLSQGIVSSLRDDLVHSGDVKSVDDYLACCCSVQHQLQYKFRHFIFVSGELLHHFYYRFFTQLDAFPVCWNYSCCSGCVDCHVLNCLLYKIWCFVINRVLKSLSLHALRHHWLMPISCFFRDCKALLVTSRTHVSGAMASVQTLSYLYHWELVYVDILLGWLKQYQSLSAYITSLVPLLLTPFVVTISCQLYLWLLKDQVLTG